MVMKRKNAAKQPNRGSGKGKRWFVNLSGWGLDFSMASDSQSQAVTTKKKRSMVPDDCKISENIPGLAAVKHGDLNVFNPLAQIVAGTGEGNRIGSSITVKALVLRCLYATSTAANPGVAKTIRVMLLATPLQFDPGVAFGPGFGLSDTFYTTTNSYIGTPNPRKVKVLCDRQVTLQTTSGVLGTQAVFTETCVLNTPFEYQTGSKYGVAANMYWVVMVGEYGATISVTSVGDFITESLVIYEDHD